MRLKLADFGLALRLKNQNDAEENNVQHMRWCAPECVPKCLPECLFGMCSICDFINVCYKHLPFFPMITITIILLLIDVNKWIDNKCSECMIPHLNIPD